MHLYKAINQTSFGAINQCVCFPSGYMLIGSDVKLNSPMSLVGQALAEILQYPERARDALRVLLHLVRQFHTSRPIIINLNNPKI